MMDMSFWDQHPHLGSPHGPEASLRQIILHYYTSHGVKQNQAEAFTAEYIRQMVFPTPGEIAADTPADDTAPAMRLKRTRRKALRVVDRDGVALVCENENGRPVALARFTGPDRRAQAEDHARFMMENRRLAEQQRLVDESAETPKEEGPSP